MYEIAIVEDDKNDMKVLKAFIDDYMQRSKKEYNLRCFTNALDFLDGKKDTDIVFFDIEMPYLKGIDAVRRLRKTDDKLVVVFYSSAAQYALDGYAVDALDFLLKPATAYEVDKKLSRTLSAVDKVKSGKYLLLHDEYGNVAKVDLGDISYVEKERNYLVFHSGEKVYRERKNLYEYEQELCSCNFAKVRSGVMVNLKFIEKYNSECVTVGGVQLYISRGEYKNFISKMMAYFNRF